MLYEASDVDQGLTEVLESHRMSYDEIKGMGKGRNKAYDEF